MKWKEVFGWTFIINGFVSICYIAYFNMNFGWFYDYKDTALIIPIVLVTIGLILYVLSGEIQQPEFKWLGDEFNLEDR